MLPPLAAYLTSDFFILVPIRRQSSKLLDLGFRNRPGKFETGELQIVGQEIRVGMRQAFQHHDGGRSSEVNHTLTECVPASVRKSTADSIQAGSILGSVQSPQRRHQ